MFTRLHSFHSRRPDALPMLLLVLVAAVAGIHALRDWQGPAYTLTNELYIPAAMFASGQGFINPPLEEVPGLRDFLHQPTLTAAFIPKDLPPAFSATELHTYQRYHRYLVFSMGMVWRCFGVSWESAKLLAVALYGAAVLAAYAMFRLALNPRWSFLGAILFALSGVALDHVYNIRDFSKVPFLIAAMGLMGLLLKAPVTARRYLLSAALLGLVAGIGAGFRRDVMILLPPALLCIALAELTVRARALQIRAIAIALFALLFALSAAPVLFSLQERGSAIEHDILMGMSAALEPGLSIHPADYNRIPHKQDFYITALTNSLAREQWPLEAIEYHNLYGDPPHNKTRAYLVAQLLRYPADVLLRGIAATLAIIRGIEHSTLFSHFAFAGPLYALVALYLLARRQGPGRALPLLMVVVYFAAMTSLQYESRHAIHMYLLPLACLLCFWHAIAQRLSVLRKPGDPLSRSGIPPAMAFMAAVLLTPALLWMLALAWQVPQVRAMETRLREAPTTHIPTNALEENGWTWRHAVNELTPALPDPEEGITFIRPHYLMCELEAYPDASPIAVRFRASEPLFDYSGIVSAAPVDTPDGATVRYFFRAPECIGDSIHARFDAIGIPSAYAARFKGLYRVDADLLAGAYPDLALVDGRDFRPFQTLNLAYSAPPMPAWPSASPP